MDADAMENEIQNIHTEYTTMWTSFISVFSQKTWMCMNNVDSHSTNGNYCIEEKSTSYLRDYS